MPILNKLNIAAEESRNQHNPFAKAKLNLLTNLAIQLKAAEAMVVGKPYLVTKMQTVEENGVNVRKPVERPLRHWYWRDSAGAVRFAVRVSNKRIELSKGKTDIVVGKDAELPSVIQQLIEAVNAGELDNAIENVAALRKMRKTAK